MAFLKQSYGTQAASETYEVNDGITVIGRHEECDVVIESPAVSRRHAQIVYEDNRYCVEDLHSRNGTSVNGRQIREPTRLNDGDTIEFSTLPYVFRTESPSGNRTGDGDDEPRIVDMTTTGSDSGDSIRRQRVATGDRISNDALGADSIREAQLLGKLQVADSGRAWPVTSNASLKLNHSLRLLHSLRQSLCLDETISQALPVLFDLFAAAERIAIVLREDDGMGMHVVAAVSRQPGEEVEICLPVVRSAIHHAEAILYVDHWKRNESRNPELQDATVRTILAVPLAGHSGSSIGAVQMDTTSQTSALTKDDLERFVVLSHVLAFSIENAKAFEKETRRVLLERGKQFASRLTSRMTPVNGPMLQGYRINHRRFSAPDVSTDLIDYIPLPDGRVACMLIDVPGRGLEAAELMALQSRLLMRAMIASGDPVRAIENAQDALRERIPDISLVISMAMLILDPASSLVTVSIAGHCPAILVTKQNVTDLKNPEISTSSDGSYNESCAVFEIQLNDNDLLVLFTDGITKLESIDGTTLNRQQITDLVCDAASGPANDFDARLSRNIEDYRMEAVLPDDIAFVAVMRNSDANALGDEPSWKMESETQEA